VVDGWLFIFLSFDVCSFLEIVISKEKGKKKNPEKKKKKEEKIWLKKKKSKDA
jgi:hypothetical protein